MTTGQIVFFSGVTLLVLTIILAIIFIIRKPRYIPGNAIYGEADRDTQKLHNGYPTDRLTIRRESARSINPDTVVLSGGKARLAAEQTEKLMGTAVLPEFETEKLQEGTTPLPDGTAKLQQTEKLAGPEDLPEREVESQPEGTMSLVDGTVKLQQAEETVQLYDQSGASKGGTEKLDSSKEEGI